MKKRKQAPRLLGGVNRSQTTLFVGAVIIFVVGIAVGYLMSTPTPTKDAVYEVASKKLIDTAKDEIRTGFKAQSTDNCGQPAGEGASQDRSKVFEQYLKVNKYANRAVIRGCSDVDNLLAKNPVSGKWEMTSVNIALDARANPVWQRVCLIDDITVADTKTRPENTSIDVGNLVGCRKLSERDQVAHILRSTGQKPSEAGIKEYIRGSEEFIDAFDKQNRQ